MLVGGAIVQPEVDAALVVLSACGGDGAGELVKVGVALAGDVGEAAMVGEAATASTTVRTPLVQPVRSASPRDDEAAAWAQPIGCGPRGSAGDSSTVQV
jgi:hypothetical protein